MDGSGQQEVGLAARYQQMMIESSLKLTHVILLAMANRENVEPELLDWVEEGGELSAFQLHMNEDQRKAFESMCEAQQITYMLNKDEFLEDMYTVTVKGYKYGKDEYGHVIHDALGHPEILSNGDVLRMDSIVSKIDGAYMEHVHKRDSVEVYTLNTNEAIERFKDIPTVRLEGMSFAEATTFQDRAAAYRVSTHLQKKAIELEDGSTTFEYSVIVPQSAAERNPNQPDMMSQLERIELETAVITSTDSYSRFNELIDKSHNELIEDLHIIQRGGALDDAKYYVSYKDPNEYIKIQGETVEFHGLLGEPGEPTVMEFDVKKFSGFDALVNQLDAMTGYASVDAKTFDTVGTAEIAQLFNDYRSIQSNNVMQLRELMRDDKINLRIREANEVLDGKDSPWQMIEVRISDEIDDVMKDTVKSGDSIDDSFANTLKSRVEEKFNVLMITKAEIEDITPVSDVGNHYEMMKELGINTQRFEEKAGITYSEKEDSLDHDMDEVLDRVDENENHIQDSYEEDFGQ